MNIDELHVPSDGSSPSDRSSYGGAKATHHLPLDRSTPNNAASFLHQQTQQQQSFLHYSSLGSAVLNSQASLASTASPLSGDGISMGTTEDVKPLYCNANSAIDCAVVKTEPNNEMKFSAGSSAQALGYGPQNESLSSRAADKLYPLVIAEYYMNPILFIDDNKEKVTAQCKRCGRPVTGWWSPRLVTSNFITHLKSCSVELYQHFLETKKRCGWTARRYTIKLRADASVVAPWKGEGSKMSFSLGEESKIENSHSEGRSPSEEAPSAFMDAGGDQVSEGSSSSAHRPRGSCSAHLLRGLAEFAAEDLRPPASLLSGAVERLLFRFAVRVEMPSEERIRSYLMDHQETIQTIAFTDLPPLDNSAILLGVHSSVKRDCLSCIVCYWCCSISAGQLHKRLFSVRRYGNLETALRQVAGDLRNARRFQRSLSDTRDATTAEVTSQEPALVISRNPSSYLRIPFFGREGHADPPADSAVASDICGLPHRVIDDVPQQLWAIFTSSIRRVDTLARLLDVALGHLGAAVMEPASPLVDPGECTFFTTQLRLLSRLTAPLDTGDHAAKVFELFNLLEATLGQSYETLYACLVALLSMGQYFASAVQRLHGRGVTISNFLPLLLGLQKKVGAAESSCEPSLVASLRQIVVGQLENALDRYCLGGEGGEPSVFLLATFADPQYKLFWVEDTDQEKNYRDKIIKFLSRRLPKVSATTGTAVQPDHPEVDDGLLDFVAKRRRMAISEAGCEWPLVDEVNNYLVNKDVAPALEFWASERRQGIFPNIFKLHREVHSVAVSCFDACIDTGLSSEHLMEAIGPGRWARESADVFELLVLAKCYRYDFSGCAKTKGGVWQPNVS